ncbi:MAG: glycosyltransferase family 2 protein [Gammaproteobacteria bacterium]
MHKLSVVIITKNEEKFIADAIKSVNFADEVLVLDSGSLDKTCEIAKTNGARVEHQEWLGFGPQKNKAVNLAKNHWVFVLDADERVTVELAAEVKCVLQNKIASDGFYVARLNYFFGKEVKSCGLYPDYSIRLFNREKGKFSEAAVHESVQLQGKVDKLNNHMVHLAYDNISEFIEKQNKYSSLNNNANKIKALFSPIWTFFKLYILKKGFSDGWRGFVIASLYAQYTFWKYIK